MPQMQDFMRLYSGLVERCFNACAQDFTSKALTTNEVSVDAERRAEVWAQPEKARGARLDEHRGERD